MVITRRRFAPRAFAFLATVLVGLAGSAVLAAPAQAALDPTVATWGIKSIGEAFASRDTVTIKDTVLEIGFVGPQEIKFRFEMDACCEIGTPARFLGGAPDAACATIGTVPTTIMECTYTRQIQIGRDEEFDFSFPSSRPAQTGHPSIKTTITVAGTSMTRSINAQRVKPEADFMVTGGVLAKGRVGEIVEFEWTLANVGLDPVFDRNGIVALTAPAGTEFTGIEFTDAMPDITCLTAGSTPTFRQCYFEVTEPGQAKAHKQKWQLKIVSEQVGEGKISAEMRNTLGAHPEYDYEDPTPANNVVPIREAPIAAPPGGGELPITGLRTGTMVAGGVGVLLVGALLVLLVRRRRVV